MSRTAQDPTLGQVVDALGPATVRLLTPASAGTAVGGPRLWDPADLSGLAPGDIVLGVNVDPADAADALERVGGTGAAALALRGDVAGLGPRADALGVALLAVAPEATWDHVYALLQRAAATIRPAQEDAPPMGDLFAFANALAALVGGAVAVEDPRGRLLAYSNLDQPIDEARRQTILGRGNPPSWSALLESEGYSRLLATTAGPVRIVDPEGRASERVATLVRAGTEVLGSIWVVAGSAPLPADAEQVVADATPLAAMQLLRHGAAADSTRRERGQLLRALLTGEPADTDLLGIDHGSTCQVVAFHLQAADDDLVGLSVARTRLVDAVTMACEAFRRRVVCTWVGPTIYALLPDVSPDGAERLRRLTEDLCARGTAALGVEVLAGISDPQVGLGAAPQGRAEADRVLRVLRSGVDRKVATLDDVRIPSVLLSLADLVRNREDLRVPGVRTLRQHDQDHGKQYVTSLRAYLAAGSIPAAAAALGIHANTMRYRIGRIQEISGLTLDDPEHRLVASLELLVVS